MIEFAKMHGIGNDFILLDGVNNSLPAHDFPSLSRSMNDRRFGVGGDGLILVERGETAPFRMRMFNPDGSESEMCGNGIRCVGMLLDERDYLQSRSTQVETGAGILEIEIDGDGSVKVDMGKAHLERGTIPMAGKPSETFIEQPLELDGRSFVGTAVSMGNPHLVIFVDDLEQIALEDLGPRFEHHLWFPNRTNVHFAQLIGKDEISQRTWERGAGVTLACGTGACAVAVAGHLSGRTGRNVIVHLPGGDLRIHYDEDGTVIMSGPAELVFTGSWIG